MALTRAFTVLRPTAPLASHLALGSTSTTLLAVEGAATQGLVRDHLIRDHLIFDQSIRDQFGVEVHSFLDDDHARELLGGGLRGRSSSNGRTEDIELMPAAERGGGGGSGGGESLIKDLKRQENTSHRR